MTKLQPKQLLQIELLWWLITIVVVAAVMLPIFTRAEDYPFYEINVLYIVTFITLSRYIFLLPFTFLAHRQVWKAILVFLCVPLIFYLVQELNFFQTFLDEYGPKAVVGDLPYRRLNGMINYVRNEMLLFGMGAIISAVVLPFRLLLSIWRNRNRGTV